jgi:hypothetical protein
VASDLVTGLTAALAGHPDADALVRGVERLERAVSLLRVWSLDERLAVVSDWKCVPILLAALRRAETVAFVATAEQGELVMNNVRAAAGPHVTAVRPRLLELQAANGTTRSLHHLRADQPHAARGLWADVVVAHASAVRSPNWPEIAASLALTVARVMS